MKKTLSLLVATAAMGGALAAPASAASRPSLQECLNRAWSTPYYFYAYSEIRRSTQGPGRVTRFFKRRGSASGGVWCAYNVSGPYYYNTGLY